MQRLTDRCGNVTYQGLAVSWKSMGRECQGHAAHVCAEQKNLDDMLTTIAGPNQNLEVVERLGNNTRGSNYRPGVLAKAWPTSLLRLSYRHYVASMIPDTISIRLQLCQEVVLLYHTNLLSAIAEYASRYGYILQVDTNVTSARHQQQTSRWFSCSSASFLGQQTAWYSYSETTQERKIQSVQIG